MSEVDFNAWIRPAITDIVGRFEQEGTFEPYEEYELFWTKISQHSDHHK